MFSLSLVLCTSVFVSKTVFFVVLAVCAVRGTVDGVHWILRLIALLGTLVLFVWERSMLMDWYIVEQLEVELLERFCGWNNFLLLVL